jgi:hypothetical protein
MVANRDMAKKAWDSKHLEPHTDQIIQSIHIFAKTTKWQNGYGPKLSKFLLDGDWKTPPKLPYGKKSGF